MKRNFTNENLEELLRRSANGLRMRPSDKVWKEISKSLHKKRRRAGIALGTLLIAIGTLGYFALENSARPVKTIGTTHQFQTPVEKTFSKNSPGAHSSGTIQSPGSISFSQPLAKHNLIAAQKTNALSSDVASLETTTAINENAETDSNTFTSTIVDSYLESPIHQQTGEKAVTGTGRSEELPQTIESVVNSYKAKPLQRKLSFQFYFTPTVSYRKLGENKSFLRTQPVTNNPNYTPAFLYDINNVVTHKPNMGIELGMAMKYPVTSRMRIRGGLQFNVNRYDIKAYNAMTSVATIVLNGRSSNRADSLNTLSNYSNANGYKSDWLENYYVQISAPIGVEFKLNRDEKVEFGIATTIQPTYVLGDRTYLISTDYKNYVEVPQLVRRWNVNTALETFVGYSTGKLNWQVGPQVRYQLLSSFINKYPVKENLFDFGLKVGVSVNHKQ